jgi:hypothetical protein
MGMMRRGEHRAQNGKCEEQELKDLKNEMAWLVQQHIMWQVMMKRGCGEDSGKLHVIKVIGRGMIEKKTARSQRKPRLKDLEEGNGLR